MIDVSPTTLADPQKAGLSSEGIERLRGAFTGLIDARRLPGCVMLIVRRGVVGLLDVQGRQDPALAAPMRLDSIFRIYSMTKPIVSVAVMMLFERGRLLLSDPVAKYLPEFASVQLGVEREDGSERVLERVPPDRAMTVQDLLRHTSGLTYEILPRATVRGLYAKAEVGSQHKSNAEQVSLLASMPLMHQPGAVWEYSRATDVLGRLIEVLSGQSLGEFLRREIFVPLGMVDTGFDVPASQHGRLAEPFTVDPDSGQPVRLIDVRTPHAAQSGGGGLASTLPDYARFTQMLANHGSFGGARLLGRKTIELMTADHLGDIKPTTELLPPGYGFGLGFAVRTHAGIASIAGSVGSYHWGGIAGTQFFVDPAEQMFAVLMTQAPGQRDEFRPLFRNLVYAALDA